METYGITALITIATSLLIFYLAFNVWKERRKYKSSVLESTKKKEILIANRVHMNTIELSVVYVPLLWIATIYGSVMIASVLWVIWFVSRVWYAFAYLKEPKSRQIPFMIGIPCIFLTALLGACGIIF